jgi:hypothetical protein
MIIADGYVVGRFIFGVLRSFEIFCEVWDED